jgi:biopolymer transport protein ExbD
MEIVTKELSKTLEIFKILGAKQGETKQHLEKLKNALLMDAAAEAFAEKGHFPEDGNFSQEEVEDFLLDNYDQEEIEQIVLRVSRDVIVEYFSKVLKNVPEDKLEQVDLILKTKFE